MIAWLQDGIETLLYRRSVRRWSRAAGQASSAELERLRRLRTRARGLRRRLNKVIHTADSRLTLPLIGNNAFKKPLGSDWSYRPEMWREQIEIPGAAAVENNTEFGSETKVFHDCETSELVLRQVRNTREKDLAPFGARMEVFRFDGSFLSMVVELPSEAIQGLTKRFLVRFEAIIETEKPIEIFVRLNVKHGPNTEQIVRELAPDGAVAVVEFDLAYSELNEKRAERMWLDLIFENPEMNQIILRDVTVSRRPRSEL